MNQEVIGFWDAMAPHHSFFTGRMLFRPTNSVKALKVNDCGCTTKTGFEMMHSAEFLKCWMLSTDVRWQPS